MPTKEARKDWMSVLARAPSISLNRAVEALGSLPDATWLRPPETGAIMVRGRQGGTGAPFNLGEMTVTRCALRLADGQVGHAYVPGRDHAHARQAAICDALMQGPRAGEVEEKVLGPIRDALAADRQSQAAKAEATKVDFFTMVRGESK
ncbi:MAG: phosphonate C-P lyase system protein PhnG [Pseudomonadota bacterium]